jgi:glucose-6-phosphate-specific signal transduction histidine kinase
MRSFAQLTDFPTMKFTPLLVSVIVIVASIVGLVTGFSIHYIVGISLTVALIVFPLLFLFLIQYLLRHKDYLWTTNVAQFINKRTEILRFLLQVLFMNPYAHRRLTNDTMDCKKMKYISKYEFFSFSIDSFYLDLFLLNMEKFQLPKVKKLVRV